MPAVIRRTELQKDRRSADRMALDEWRYPSGMVWCPMKRSGMALMKCAEMQKKFGCGNLRQFKMVSTATPANVPFFWPWLRRSRECPERANEQKVRELRLELSPLKLVGKNRKNSHAYYCPACGGSKVFDSRRCRRCWRRAVTKSES